MTDADVRARWRAQVEERPRVWFLYGRDPLRGPDCYYLGFMWSRNFEAMPGESVYRKRFVLRWYFRLDFGMHIER